MADLSQNEQAIKSILTNAKIIAVVGHSPKPHRTSYQIAQFLRNVGYRVYPVNPGVSEIDGQPCYACLTDIPERIDIVNVFRKSEYLSDIVDEAITINAGTIWTQLGIYDQFAAQKALNAGLNIVINKCIKIEYLSLLS